jgi:hypothetical protein
MSDELCKWNAYLMGAPSGVLVAIFAITLGYVLKTIPRFDNRYIPIVVVSFCTCTFMLVAPTCDINTPLRIWLARNFMIGLVIGGAAWLFHAQFLRRFVDPRFFQVDDTKPKDPPSP